MKKSNIIPIGALVAAACCGAYYWSAPAQTLVVSETAPLASAPKSSSKGKADSAKPAADAKIYTPPAEGSVPATDWLEPAQLQATLGPKIISAIQAAGGTDPEQVAAFMKKPENRLMVAQWLVAQSFIDSAQESQKRKAGYDDNLGKCRKAVEDIRATLPKGKGKPSHRQEFNLSRAQEALTEAQAESNAPHTMQEILNAKGGRALVEAILNNVDWMDKIAFSGEITDPGKTLGILVCIAKKYPNFAKNTMSRDIATATALEYGRYNWNVDRAVKRYNYFNTHFENGDLNTVFDKLPFWQRRIVCGAKGDNDFCSVESLEWSLENVKIPQDQYSGCCWRCGYKLQNPYGESIHGSLFGAPFDEIYGHNRMRFTLDVGGVCGSLSHFGAYSACANGIPALTAGEPGHCAYVVLVGDKWTPSYSLSYERGLHWQVFKDVHWFSSLHMATDMFSQKQKEATDLSNAYRALAGELARIGKNDTAQAAYVRAVTAQPNNYYAWREYAQFLKAKAPTNGPAWCKLNELVCKQVAPTYPEMAALILANHVYDGMKEALGSDTKKLRTELVRFWGAAKEMGPDRWRIEQHLSKQLQVLGIDEKQPDKVISFASRIIKKLSNNNAYLPIAFAWTNGLADKFTDQKAKKSMLQASIKALSGMKEGSLDDRKKVLSPLIIAAEKARDMKTFQAIRKMFPQDFTKNAANIPAFDPFPGKLMSQNGLVWTSSTCRYDDPCEHPFLLEPVGGRFHSDKQNDAWIAVELTKQTNVSGIVVVLTQHNMQRCFDIHVQISETGRDDDWHDVNVTAKPGRVIRVDLQGKAPLAKYVRVLRAGGPEFFHLNGIYVYGKPAA